MEPTEINDFLSGALITASQLAYIEEARGAYRILTDTTAVFSFLSRPAGETRLSEELAVLRQYADIQRMRAPDRFDIVLPERAPAAFVERGGLVGFLHRTLGSIESAGRGRTRVVLSFGDEVRTAELAVTDADGRTTTVREPLRTVRS